MKLRIIAAVLLLGVSLSTQPVSAESVGELTHLSLIRVNPDDETGEFDFSEYYCRIAYCVTDGDEALVQPENFNLGVALTVKNAYYATADLHCHDLPPDGCSACFSRARKNFRAALRLMVKLKLLTLTEAGDMRSAMDPFIVELKSGCSS